MLSKEEIENVEYAIKKFKGRAIDCVSVGKMLIEYKELETREQKLIEKLEEDIKIFGNYEQRKQMCKEQLFENDGKWFYAGEILKILKGEANE